MQTFVRMSKLSNVVGRSDYISNPERQEDIVAQYNGVDWKEYQAYERTHQRSAKANNEGRELIIALPNEWQQLSQLELTARMNELAQKLLPNKYEYQWAVHWNKARTNLHMHLIFSERSRQYGSKGVWDRDIYLTADGKVARRKADRAVDKDGKVKPPVHRKGDPKSDGTVQFTAKDTRYKSKEWLEQTKQEVTRFYQQYGVSIGERGMLHQFHEGKGSQSTAIRSKNERIKLVNAFFQRVKGVGFVLPSPPSEQFKAMQLAAVQPDFPLKIKSVRKFAENEPILLQISTKSLEVDCLTRSLLDKAAIPYLHSSQEGAYSFLYGEAYQSQIEQIKKEVNRTMAPVQPTPPPKPKVNIDSIVALKQDYVRKCCVFSYLKTAKYSTSEQEDYRSAQQLVKKFDAAAEQLHSLDDKIKATINPFKKMKLRSERDAAADQLGKVANELKYTLGITLIYQGREFDSSTATRDHTTAIYGYTQYPISQKRSAAEAEIKRNELIQSLSAEKIDEKSVRTALTAFQTACKGIPEEQQQEAYTALCAAHTPSFSFERGGTLSLGRQTAIENVSKIIEALKPSVPDQSEKKEAQTQDIEPRKKRFAR